MGKREVGFAVTDIFTEAGVAFGHCKKISDRSDIDTTGFTLTHLSNGQHELYVPNVTYASGPAYFFLYAAADPSKYVEGIINPVLGDEARQSLVALDATAQSILTKVNLISGSGDTAVNHNTGGVDNIRFLDGSGVPIDNVEIKAYLKTDFDAGNTGDVYIKGSSRTRVDGRWEWAINLDSGFTYTIMGYKQGAFSAVTKEVTI